MTGIHPATRHRARKLRAQMTPQERHIWGKLRESNRMPGLHFRRQAPIGPFIADFADLGRRLVIEIDGGGHGGERDRRRDEWLAAQGFRVLRFWNGEVWGNLEGVMQSVLDSLDVRELVDGVPPSPIPSPRGGGEAPEAGAALWSGGSGTGEGPANPSFPTRGRGGADPSELRGTAGPGASPPPRGEGMGEGDSPAAASGGAP